MTSMMLASAYIGGAYFFVRVLSASQWKAIKSGFLPFTLFASLLGVATVMHWETFSHHHATFWIWAALYFTTPFWYLEHGWPTGASPERQQLMSFASAHRLGGSSGLSACWLSSRD